MSKTCVEGLKAPSLALSSVSAGGEGRVMQGGGEREKRRRGGAGGTSAHFFFFSFFFSSLPPSACQAVLPCRRPHLMAFMKIS